MARLQLATLCLFVGAASANAADPTLDSLAWLAGSWIERNAEATTEEHWIAPSGGVMLGLNRSTAASGKTSFEFLRIAQTPVGISYFASPQGRPATEFKLKELAEKKVVFENPAHDFPQQIHYWLTDGALHARIQGTVNGQQRSLEWRWERQK